MDYIQKKERLDYLLELIKKERCNTIKGIAQKFNISHRTAKRMIETLRAMGHQITYSKFSNNYFVEEDKK